MIEILPCYNQENSLRLNRQGEIESILNDLEYDIIRVHKLNGRSIERLEKLEKIGIHGNLEWCDYVLSPREVSELVLRPE